MAQSTYYHSKKEDLGHNEEILGQSRTETQQANTKSFSSMSVIRRLRCLCHSNFVDYNILFSIASSTPCMLLSLTNIPWFSNAAWVSLSQLLCPGLSGPLALLVFTQDSPAIYFLFSGALWIHGERFHDPLAFMILKPAPCGWHCWVQLLAWAEPWPIWSHTSVSFWL